MLSLSARPVLADATERAAVGVPVGILVGIVTGVVFLSLLRLLFSEETATLFAVIGRLLALPAFWTGGHFLSGTIIGDIEHVRSSYAISLAATFVLIAMYPLVRFVGRVGRDVGEDD
jgi:hypothetical protein